MTYESKASYTYFMEKTDNNTKVIIAAMGGSAKVRVMTGLTKARIYQWIKQDRIPRSWAMFFKEKFQNLNFSVYIDGN